MNAMTTFYQLWNHYDVKGIWVMEGLFRTYKEALARRQEMWDDVNTPCTNDYAIIQVQGSW